MPMFMRLFRIIPLTLVLTGCTLYAPVNPRIPQPDAQKNNSNFPYRHATGVIHLHTRFSHDAHGQAEKLIRTAQDQALDYIIITEHNTLAPLEKGLQKSYGKLEVLVGSEISTKAGHLLALGISEPIDRDAEVETIIEQIHRQGGLAIIAHPFSDKTPWTDWNVIDQVDGLEVYNIVQDTLDENWLRLAAWGTALPPDFVFRSMLDRPYDALNRWDDALNQGLKLTAIGSADAHEYHYAGFVFGPYELLLKMVRTHLWIEKDQPLSPAVILDAIKQGRGYFAFDMLMDASHFRFWIKDPSGNTIIPGDELVWSDGLTFNITAPEASQIKIYRNGALHADLQISTKTSYPVSESGIYRVEVYRDRLLWIVSNPIYVTEPNNR